MGSRNYSTLLFFCLIIFIASSSAFAKHKTKKYYKPCKHLVFYFQETVYNGTNAATATSSIVAAPEGYNLTTWAPRFYFGNIVVFDDPITLDNSINSKHVGRAQGFYVFDTKNTITAWCGFSFVLNSTDYQGTINFLGPNPVFEKSRDLTIVGGSGDFFMHRGIATLTTDAWEGKYFFRLRVDIKFYECW